MTTNESEEYLQRKSETKSEDLRTPTLDLFNVLTLVEEIRDEPAGAHVKSNLKQIVQTCDRDDVEQVLEWAGQLRDASLPADRAELACLIIAELESMLSARDAESVGIAA